MSLLMCRLHFYQMTPISNRFRRTTSTSRALSDPVIEPAREHLGLTSVINTCRRCKPTRRGGRRFSDDEFARRDAHVTSRRMNSNYRVTSRDIDLTCRTVVISGGAHRLEKFRRPYVAMAHRDVNFSRARGASRPRA